MKHYQKTKTRQSFSNISSRIIHVDPQQNERRYETLSRKQGNASISSETFALQEFLQYKDLQDTWSNHSMKYHDDRLLFDPGRKEVGRRDISLSDCSTCLGDPYIEGIPAVRTFRN